MHWNGPVQFTRAWLRRASLHRVDLACKVRGSAYGWPGVGFQPEKSEEGSHTGGWSSVRSSAWGAWEGHPRRGVGWNGITESNQRVDRANIRTRWQQRCRVVTNMGIDQVNKYMKENGSQVSHHWRSILQIGKGRELEWTLWCWKQWHSNSSEHLSIHILVSKYHFLPKEVRTLRRNGWLQGRGREHIKLTWNVLCQKGKKCSKDDRNCMSLLRLP